jgi:zinc/manganese transport system substrate-binding protein
MLTRRSLTSALAIGAFATLLAAVPASAQDKPGDKLRLVASFSILGDVVKNVGGERVEVSSLVGPNGDAHTFEPSPADAQRVAAADVVVVNGLGFEGWLDRLIAASGTKAPIVVASKGVTPLKRDNGRLDPHAWQSVANVMIYVANIRDGLIASDPANKAVYESNAASYLMKLTALDREIRDAVARIPPDRRRVITSHRAFGYFEEAYGVTFDAPLGISDDAEPSAKDIAAIIEQIRKQGSAGVFLDNVADPTLVKRIADETGGQIGGVLYSDALTKPAGPAPTYIDLMRHNVETLAATLTK